MNYEAEMIEQRMKVKREDLTKKLEKLEQQVVDTVQNTTSAVTDTVESVKGVVEETVESVKGSVEETVETVKKTFDLRLQVANHPWLMLGSSVAVGFVAGRLLEVLLPPSRIAPEEALPPPSSGGVRTNGGPSYLYEEEIGPRRQHAAPAVSSAGNWLGALTEQFAPEINRLKGLAVGAALGLVRDMVRNALPEEFGGKLSGMIDDVTEKMGGEPFKGPVAPEPTGEESPPRPGDGRGQQQSSTSSGWGLGKSGVPPFNRL
jgi:ElaB/YqjD/DUF883 family membrane-anchored ribosome-binding protein